MSVAPSRRRRPRAGGLPRDEAALAWLLTAGGVVLVAIFAALTAVQISAVVLDETVYKYAAASYLHDFPRAVIDDTTSRGIARLYSLVLAPIFAVLDGDVAVRAARAFTGLLFALTALPVHALARRVARPYAAAAAAVLAIAVPWLTIATILFSEALAYLLFACTVLAMVRALERPGAVNDVVAWVLLAALITTRVQFVVLVPAWILVLVIAEWPHRRDPRGLVRRRPVLALGLAVGVLVALALLLTGRMDNALHKLAGPYYGISQREGVRGGFGLAFLWEVLMFALGTGVVPAILAMAWAQRSLRRGASDEAARRVALVLVVCVGAVFAGALFAQGGWLDNQSEERYFLYALPLIWVGAAGAITSAQVSARVIGWGGAAFVAAAALVPVTIDVGGEQAFLAPVARVIRDVGTRIGDLAASTTGIGGVLSGQDATALVAAIVVVAGALLWRAGRRWAALAPAIVLQLAIAGWAFALVHGVPSRVPGVTAPTNFAARGWVDRAAPGPVSVVPEATGKRDGDLREEVFFNDRVHDIVLYADVARPLLPYPVGTLDVGVTSVTPDLTFTRPPLERLVVTPTDSPFLQVAGSDVARSPDGREALRRTDAVPRAAWFAAGLDPDGHVTKPVRIGAAPGERVTLRFATPATGTATSAKIRLGRKEHEILTAADPAATLRFDLCGVTAPQTGSILPGVTTPLPDGRPSAIVLTSVTTAPCR